MLYPTRCRLFSLKSHIFLQDGVTIYASVTFQYGSGGIDQTSDTPSQMTYVGCCGLSTDGPGGPYDPGNPCDELEPYGLTLVPIGMDITLTS